MADLVLACVQQYCRTAHLVLACVQQYCQIAWLVFRMYSMDNLVLFCIGLVLACNL